MNIMIPENFVIGAASSAWQTEGWKGKKDNQDSFLDLWYKNETFVWHDGYGPDTATNFMENYQTDIELMKEIKLTHYRTSINWARFFTDHEKLIVDEDYAAHIDAVIDGLLEAGVEPMLCLEHYEVPAVLLEKYDGWSSKEVVALYISYAEIVFSRYADRVHYWFTFNEPIVSQTRCYLDAIRWPHEQDTKKWMTWNYHKALATAKAVKLFHEKAYNGRIGCILNPEMVYARSSAAHDQKAAHMYDLFFNKVFFDPMILGEYPKELLDLCRTHGIMFPSTEEELAIIKNNTVDFLGINQYYPKRVRAPRYQWNGETPFHPEMFYENFELPGRKMNNSRGWEIYPKVMYDMAVYLKENYGNIPWLVTENGMGREQEEQYIDESGQVQDDYRIDFISQHLAWLLRAVEEGANCEGYMLWAFTDCVSPMNAFKNRYGLVRIELDEKRTRSLKKSGYWYKQLITDRQLILPQ
ncbi:glycoside hydrolase family 1 protein [Enterococcus sp. BWR-S5]|uniref:glycoside hydrolase family 1 protein n=1 Tax=Enterococcus sp. BWR-S5 TaxID=2787714 RepID=UPI00192220AC|nr:glycoside hydrolase family 1 protein [Enterococcus sp. BWR-S5]MBL1226352.1 glycoside hydrolase family 1 protein [Enterococcus sp. BWR-S5]